MKHVLVTFGVNLIQNYQQVTLESTKMAKSAVVVSENHSQQIL